ncbi:MAG: PhzF family phenazine biosynthesis protein [Marinilabiliaceae bacterium]|nr:PhzF family phenazine biosynthesis protein [Marinilabiliaceae bacterium]
MTLDIYQIDSFTNETFCGNPACVVPLREWLPDDILLKIAKENAVPETAFFIIENRNVKLRWFTPDIEMDLCGHATLAAAHVLFSILNYPNKKIEFSTISGILNVSLENNIYLLDFPSRMPVLAYLPEAIVNSLSIKPIEVLKARDYVLIYNSQKDIENIVIDRILFDSINISPGGVIVTSKGNDSDFVSRFFTPQATILEDPVTGSAHCSLIPYWSKLLGKQIMTAQQLSQRGGILYCENKGDRVLIGGTAKTFLIGQIMI